MKNAWLEDRPHLAELARRMQTVLELAGAMIANYSAWWLVIAGGASAEISLRLGGRTS